MLKSPTSNELKKFIKSRSYLVWYVRDPANLSPESIVEHILNYGDWDDVQKLLKIIGLRQTAAIFRKQISYPRNNYRPEITNYFKLYFQKYAQ